MTQLAVSTALDARESKAHDQEVSRSSSAIAALLDDMERADQTDSRAYSQLVEEYFSALKQEQGERQAAVMRRAQEALGLARVGKLDADTTELGQLLTTMQAQLLAETNEFGMLYHIWLTRFPQDAVRHLVTDWLRRWRNQYGAFLGFTARSLSLEYAGCLADAVTCEQVEAVLRELARQRQLIAAPLADSWAMYAVGWTVEKGAAH